MKQDPRDFLKAYELDGIPFIAFIRAAAENGKLIMVTSPGGVHTPECACAICEVQDIIMTFNEEDLDFFSQIGVSVKPRKKEKSYA